MSLHKFSELLDLLPQHEFIRVHNSYIVAIDKIEKIAQNRIYIKNKIIPIGNKYAKEFYKQINSINRL